MTILLKKGLSSVLPKVTRMGYDTGLRSVIFATLLALCSLALCSTIQADDILELEQTSIRGASELPKVLYIVPWKKLEPDDKPVKLDSMVDEIMSPVDMEILRRQVHYYNSMNKPAAESK